MQTITSEQRTPQKAGARPPARRRLIAVFAGALGLATVGLIGTSAGAASAAEAPTTVTSTWLSVDRPIDDQSWPEGVTFKFASDCTDNLVVESDAGEWVDLDGFSVEVVTSEIVNVGVIDPALDCTVTITNTSAIGTVTPATCSIDYGEDADRWADCNVSFTDSPVTAPISATDPVTVSDLWLAVHLLDDEAAWEVDYKFGSDCADNLLVRPSNSDADWALLEGYSIEVATVESLEIGKRNPLVDCTIKIDVSSVDNVEALVCSDEDMGTDPRCWGGDAETTTTAADGGATSCSIKSSAITRSIRADADLPVFDWWLDSCVALVSSAPTTPTTPTT